MGNAVSAALLSLILAGCMALNGASEQLEEAKKQTFQETTTAEQVKVLPPSSFSQKYDFEKLAKSYPAPKKLWDKTWIPVPVINQYPELPVGCEITSAAVILNYIGFDVDKVWLQENFLEDSYNFRQLNPEKRKGPDPSRVFVGDPQQSGFGCFAPVIAESLEKYFTFAGSKNTPIVLDGADERDLEALVDNGAPVIVWASLDMKPFRYTANNEWILETTGEVFRWPGNAHVIVLCGYDKEGYYFSDCNDKDNIVRYDKKTFLNRWKQFGSQGVVVEINDD